MGEKGEKNVAVSSPPSGLPDYLRRLHNRLSKETELYKLHLKHYHMSGKQFRRRTSELALPDHIYDKYEKVCKTCENCSKARPAPCRSRVSGIRADNFGDLIFIDHAEVKYHGAKYLVLLVLDAASSLLSAYPQSDLEEDTTLEQLRQWIDEMKCKPKALVADMAF